MNPKTAREAAFEALVERHKDMLWYICKDYSLSPAWEVEDAFQEVLCALWTDFEDFDDRSTERTWVYRVATNCLLMIKRKIGNQPTVDVPVDPQEAAPDTENYDTLMQLIETLKEPDRTVVRAHLDGFRNDEIAKMLDSSITAVAMRLSRAKAKLKRQYNQIIGKN